MKKLRDQSFRKKSTSQNIMRNLVILAFVIYIFNYLLSIIRGF